MDLSEVHEQVKSTSGCSVFHVRFLCWTGSCQSPLAESKKVEEEDSLSNSSASDAEEYLGLEGRGSVGGVGGHCIVLLASLFSFKSVSRYPSSLALTLASLFILAYSLPSQRFSLCFSVASRLIFFRRGQDSSSCLGWSSAAGADYSVSSKTASGNEGVYLQETLCGKNLLS